MKARSPKYVWNSPEEKYPPNKKVVLCILATGEWMFCRFYGDGWDNAENDKFYISLPVMCWRETSRKEQYECWLKRIEFRRKNGE